MFYFLGGDPKTLILETYKDFIHVFIKDKTHHLILYDSVKSIIKAPSEHMIDFKRFDMEWIVYLERNSHSYKSNDFGNKLILSFLFESVEDDV